MKIYLYFNKQITIFYLPENVSGSYSFDIDEEEVSKLINVDAIDGKWVLFETEYCKIMDGNSFVNKTPLENNKFYVISRNNINYLIYSNLSDDKNTKAFSFGDQLNIKVGVEGATASFDCPYIKGISVHDFAIFCFK